MDAGAVRRVPYRSRVRRPDACPLDDIHRGAEQEADTVINALIDGLFVTAMIMMLLLALIIIGIWIVEIVQEHRDRGKDE